MLKKIITLLIIVCSMGFSDNKKERIQEVVDLVMNDADYKSIFDANAEKAIDMLDINTELTESRKKELSKLISDKSNEVFEEFIKNDVINIYDKYYTEKEVDKLYEFYTSEEGNSIAQKMPEVINETNNILMDKYMSKITDVIVDIYEEVLGE